MHTEVPEIRNLILKNTKSLQMQGKNALMVMMMMMMMMMIVMMIV